MYRFKDVVPGCVGVEGQDGPLQLPAVQPRLRPAHPAPTQAML